MKNQGEDARAVRTAGLVLVGIGALALVISILWNNQADEFEFDSLISTTGTVTGYETRIIKTKTSNEEWIVLEVSREIEGVPGAEFWVFPAHSTKIEARLSLLELPAEVSGLLVAEPVLVRWEKGGIRLVWALHEGEEIIVPYSLARDVAAEGRYASPVIGIATMGMGLAFVFFSRVTG